MLQACKINLYVYVYVPDLELQIMIINFDRKGTICGTLDWVPTGYYTNIGRF
jgi:hypothetical protein